MDFIYSWIPGYTRWVTTFWQYLSAEECKHITLISRGPELPLTSILTLCLLCKYVIPYIIKRRGRAYDTRPLEIVFHGFFFGIFGIGLCVGFYVFKGYMQFLSCSRIPLHPVLVPLRSYMAVIGIIAIHGYSIHFLFVALNGRKVNWVHLLYHSFSLFFACFGANYQPDENVCFCVVTEVCFLVVYSMLQVLNSASIEVKENLVGIRTKIYLNYVAARQYQMVVLILHALIHLLTDCTMKKDLAILQLVCVLMFKQLFKRELVTKLELPYCDDSFLKTSDHSYESYLKASSNSDHWTASNHSANELEGKKAD